ncbi:MAG: hypothetical protein NTX25_03420 [Proteobacteria bacterium]|nr:hypothetical protein [Pseudomonadota bacterium]
MGKTKFDWARVRSSFAHSETQIGLYGSIFLVILIYFIMGIQYSDPSRAERILLICSFFQALGILTWLVYPDPLDLDHEESTGKISLAFVSPSVLGIGTIVLWILSVTGGMDNIFSKYVLSAPFWLPRNMIISLILGMFSMALFLWKAGTKHL